MRCFKCGAQGHQRKQHPRKRDRAEAEQDKGAPGVEEVRGDQGPQSQQSPRQRSQQSPRQRVPEAESTPQHKRHSHSQALTDLGQEAGQSEEEFEIVAKKEKWSEGGEPKWDPGLVSVGSGEKTQSPSVKVAKTGGDPQSVPEEELTSSPEAVPPCPEEESRSTELPQSDYEIGREPAREKLEMRQGRSRVLMAGRRLGMLGVSGRMSRLPRHSSSLSAKTKESANAKAEDEDSAAVFHKMK
ncbi:hypothetical protein EOD39_12198 [Acipenser ruthenus]|uniref:Uncharacterized protein n=1 Tax=Acipenser ruthenus TaxID=7906 RepID=A0A662YRA3_ACIRT|nr:hypothetical protein EOD39_12198 [Acipenser ruthenus]